MVTSRIDAQLSCQPMTVTIPPSSVFSLFRSECLSSNVTSPLCLASFATPGGSVCIGLLSLFHLNSDWTRVGRSCCDKEPQLLWTGPEPSRIAGPADRGSLEASAPRMMKLEESSRRLRNPPPPPPLVVNIGQIAAASWPIRLSIAADVGPIFGNSRAGARD